MIPDGDKSLPIDFLAEPTFVIRRSGRVLEANSAARRLLGSDPRSRDLFDFLASPREDFERYLKQCSGTTSPLVGSITLRAKDGDARLRVHGARLRGGGAEPRLAIRCLPSEQFSLLTQHVRELNTQLRERLHEKVVLEEALREKKTLLKELQHRVKNNIQMMMSLISMSARGKGSDEVQAVVDAAELRLQAMSSTQEAIYQSQRSRTVGARPFLEGLVEPIRRSVDPSAKLRLAVEDTVLSHEVAHALALIVNELVTNAIKHGLNGDSGTIDVTLERVENDLRLVVKDTGPGVDPGAGTRSSGLRLVRGLCRQIGGAFEIGNENGARCEVRFSDRV